MQGSLTATDFLTDQFSNAGPSRYTNTPGYPSTHFYTGTLPEALGKCTGLEVIEFIGQDFEGTIPKSYGDLTSLTHLSLAGNDLTGELHE